MFAPALIVIVLDQLTKFLVRTTPYLHNLELIPGWLSLHYTRNPGMALGIDWLSTFAISCIAILATIGIFIYILKTLEEVSHRYLFFMGLILGGAIGNILDRIFMGLIDTGDGILEGHVVDFIHFTPTISGYPVFPYIFNIADVAISVAIISLIVFHRSILPEDFKKPREQKKVTEENQMVDKKASQEILGDNPDSDDFSENR